MIRDANTFSIDTPVFHLHKPTEGLLYLQEMRNAIEACVAVLLGHTEYEPVGEIRILRSKLRQFRHKIRVELSVGPISEDDRQFYQECLTVLCDELRAFEGENFAMAIQEEMHGSANDVREF